MSKDLDSIVFGMVEGRGKRMEKIFKDQDLRAYNEEMKGWEGQSIANGHIENRNGNITITRDNGKVETFTSVQVFKHYAQPQLF